MKQNQIIVDSDDHICLGKYQVLSPELRKVFDKYADLNTYAESLGHTVVAEPRVSNYGRIVTGYLFDNLDDAKKYAEGLQNPTICEACEGPGYYYSVRGQSAIEWRVIGTKNA